ncbi:hypothetical protein HDU84_001077 [Entophlyctis sp. JEL0112]|nr:hypothetical protein HDU84_001077 [Entophlyctis sp. JEL0112]
MSRPQLPPRLDFSCAASATAAHLAPISSSISLAPPAPLFASSFSSSVLSPPTANSSSAAASTSTSPAGQTFLTAPPPSTRHTGAPDAGISSSISAPTSPSRNSRATAGSTTATSLNLLSSSFASAAPMTAPPTGEYPGRHMFWDNVVLPPLHEHLRQIQQHHHHHNHGQRDAGSWPPPEREEQLFVRPPGDAGVTSARQDADCKWRQESPCGEYRPEPHHQYHQQYQPLGHPQHWEHERTEVVQQQQHQQHQQQQQQQQPQQEQIHTQDGKLQTTHQQEQQLHQLHNHSYRRFKPSAQHLALLTSVFSKNAFPSRTLREKLARLFGVESKQVQVWFQNRRQMAKRVNATSTSSSTPTSSVSPAAAGSASAAAAQYSFAGPAAAGGELAQDTPPVSL